MNDTSKASTEHSSELGGHVVSPRTLLLTFGALALLTATTIAVSRIDLGQLNVVAALAIACTKAALVAAFFMHLKYEGRFNLVILLASLAFVLVFVTFVLMDTRTYQPDIRSYERSAHPTSAAFPDRGPQHSDERGRGERR